MPDIRDIMRRAVAVMVVPELVKGGFIVGGEGGDAVLLTRSAGGKFENPRFYFLGSLSLGLQIGLEVAEVVLCVMSQRALQAWAHDEVKLGAQAGLTVLVVGTNAQAAATTNANKAFVGRDPRRRNVKYISPATTAKITL